MARREKKLGPNVKVPGRPGISLKNLTPRARKIVLKNEADFREMCKSYGHAAVIVMAKMMTNAELESSKLRAAEWLAANAFGTPRAQRPDVDERDGAKADVRIEGGLPEDEE